MIKYGRRAHSDPSYPINEALRRLEQPTLLITGDHDDIVNNQLTIAALEKSGRSFVTRASGAGHYIHDLQYPYFRWILGEWLAVHSAPTSTARVRVGQVCQKRPANTTPSHATKVFPVQVISGTLANSQQQETLTAFQIQSSSFGGPTTLLLCFMSRFLTRRRTGVMLSA